VFFVTSEYKKYGMYRKGTVIMAKRKEDVKILAKSIDYIKVVDEMSEAAFSFCISYLYPLYNYRVLCQSDIRRIDLKENLMRISSLIPSELKEMGILNYYLFELKLYLESILICEEGSRAEMYKKRIVDAIEKALSENGSIADVDDAFLGFMILLHSFSNKMNGIINPLFRVEQKDAELLKELFENKKGIPKGIDGKKSFIDKRLSIGDEKLNATKFLFINNIIFLSRALQSFGAFDMEE